MHSGRRGEGCKLRAALPGVRSFVEYMSRHRNISAFYMLNLSTLCAWLISSLCTAGFAATVPHTVWFAPPGRNSAIFWAF